MAQIVIVHGWMGNPQRNWLPWLVEECSKLGHSASAPQFPDTEEPHLKQWVKILQQTVKNPDDAILVGHSLGCDAILRYVETLPKTARLPLIILVAPFIDPDDSRDNADFGGKPIDIAHVKQVAPRITAMFSDNDSHIPLKEGMEYQAQLGAKIIILKKKGHFTQEDGCIQLPKVIDEIRQR